MCKFMPARQQNSPRHGCCIACSWQVVFASLEESLRMMRSLLGDTDHSNMAATLSALGKLYLQAGGIAKAKENLKESLRMTQSLISGTCHPDTAATLLALGKLYLQDGDATKAQNCLEESLLMTRRLLPDIGDNDTSSKAATLLACGEVCLRIYGSRYFHQAPHLLEGALLMTRSCLGEASHPEIAPALLALGKLYLQAGDLTNSKSCLEESLRMTRSLLGDTQMQGTPT